MGGGNVLCRLTIFPPSFDPFQTVGNIVQFVPLLGEAVESRSRRLLPIVLERGHSQCDMRERERKREREGGVILCQSISMNKKL